MARQTDKNNCSEEVGSFIGHNIRSLKIVMPRWSKQSTSSVLNASPLDVLREGAVFTDDKSSNTMSAIRAALKNDGIEAVKSVLSNKLETEGEFGIARIEPCVIPVPETVCEKSGLGKKCIDVSYKPFYIGVDLYRIGKNILPVPRANLPTALPSVPKPLRILNPVFGVNYDRAFGFSASGEISTDLINDFKGSSEDIDSKPLNTRLNLRLQADKSVNNSFYRTRSALSFERKLEGSFLEEIIVEGSFDSKHEPFAEGEIFVNSGRIGLGLNIRPDSNLFRSISLNAGYRYANNRFFSNDGLQREAKTESALELRSIIDGRLLGGFSRIAVWADSNKPDAAPSYRRIAGTIGYAKEIPLSLNQTIGLEIIAGAGRGWGSLPEYARFRSGNKLGNFLYEEARSDLLVEMPIGPLLRSFGKNQGGVFGTNRGGTSFWHFNLNAAFPIPALSSPLIPNETVGDIEDEESESGASSANSNLPAVCRMPNNALTLKNIVKNSARNAYQFLVALYEREGMTREQARKAAARDVQEICPAVFYLADYANLYAVKPLFMFDAARLSTSGSNFARTKYAVGGGLQFVVVVARFDVGYMRTVNPSAGDQKGNFVLRLTFQNLF